MRKDSTNARLKEEGAVEPDIWMRRLDDSEVAAVSRDAPAHEYWALRSIIHYAPTDKGWEAVSKYFNDEIESRQLTLESQKLLWLAHAKMACRQGFLVRRYPQISLF